MTTARPFRQRLSRAARPAAFAAATIAGAAALLLAAAPAPPADIGWAEHGGGPGEQRFSPLDQITPANVATLGLAGSLDLETDRGQEATPIVVDGVIYIASAYNVIHAADARTGRELWRYDPQSRAGSAASCCGPVSRGVAVAGGRVFAATLDGRLLALDAKTGGKLWEVDTIDRRTPWADRYSITGAPRIAGGKVVIGNGGAEFAVRGYVTAYDVATGRKAWRFYTVPGKPGVADGAASDPQMAKATASWAGEWWTKGGGGTVWDSIVYDPELDLLYLGTGNGSPWNQAIRSAGKGDNLFVSSIVAVRPETGEYVWHYQETPGDTWDYTATQNMILATLPINGKPRRVLLQAPKNGFFYVIDRATGTLLSATPYAKQTWTTGVDMATGRPVETPGARYYVAGKPVLQTPGSAGAHNWYPMAFSPQTGLVYIPVLDSAMLYDPVGTDPARTRGNYTGVTLGDGPRVPAAALEQVRALSRGLLVAWDPVARRARWTRPLAADSNGGVLATAGGLIFQGTADRLLIAYDARDGRPLWQFDTQAGVSAPPVSYRIGGVQYVALVSGWGGALPVAGGDFARGKVERIGPNRLLIFRLGATGTLPPTPVFERPPLVAAATAPDPAAARRGQALFATSCNRCHGIAAVSASAYPDLRRSPVARSDALYDVVLAGALADRGMPSFAKVLRRQDVADIRAYLDARATEDHAAGER